MTTLTRTIAIGLAGALSLAAVSPSSAAPVANAAALKQAVPGGATAARWRGGGVAAGVGLGLLGGALIAGAYGPRYYGYYGYPGYAYYPGPYYGPYWGPRRYYGWRRYGWRHYRRW